MCHLPTCVWGVKNQLVFIKSGNKINAVIIKIQVSLICRLCPEWTAQREMPPGPAGGECQLPHDWSGRTRVCMQKGCPQKHRGAVAGSLAAPLAWHRDGEPERPGIPGCHYSKNPPQKQASLPTGCVFSQVPLRQWFSTCRSRPLWRSTNPFTGVA